MRKSPKLAAIATGVVSLMFAAFTLAPVSADSPGQIEGGSIYRIKNLTKNTDFTNPASAGSCEELMYSIRLHNSGYGGLSNIVVKATLPAGESATNVSNATVTYSGGAVSSTTASATLNLNPAQSVSYKSGSAELVDVNGKFVKSLPDGITQTGVNVGTLLGSTTEYVHFKAKTKCTPPPTCETDHSLCPEKPTCKTNPKLCPPPVHPPSTPPATPPATTTPTKLVNTGPGDVIGAFSAATIAGAFGYRLYLSRRLARQ